jgi:pyruvate dehydrogenase E2 component (dihydrolipoamide acetyltransferase)
MTVNQFKLPDVGEGLTEAEIVTWKVKVGDVIKVNDIVVEIETAKSLVELPSPYAGTVMELMVPEGETVPVGTPIIAVGSGDEAGAEAAAPAPAGGVEESAAVSEPGMVGSPAPKAEGVRPHEVIDTNIPPEGNATLVGYGPREGAAKRRPRSRAAAPAPSSGSAQDSVHVAFQAATAEPAPVPAVEEVPPSPVPPAGSTAGHAAGATAAKVLAKPPVRKLARDRGVDLTQVEPTGPGGTITRADVESFMGQGAAEAAPVVPLPQRGGERETRVPIKGVRKMTAQAMVSSAFTAPHVTEWVTVDATRTMRMVSRLRQDRAFRHVKVSPLLVMARAVCLAVRRTPEVNATWDENAQEIVLKGYVNLGIAAATPRGLVVPNIKDADAMSAVELASALNELTATAREGKTQPAEMSGGTFTITNVGVFGVDAGTPILNPGESAILAMGAIRKQPWVVGNRIKPRWVTTLALSFDHRIVDGEQGSRFLADVAALVEDPGNALLF